MPLAVEVIINAGSGSVSDDRADEITQLFGNAGIDARVHLVTNGDDLSDVARQAADGASDLIVAAGGDGTISTVASALVGSSKSLGVIPLGTLNNFSKDLGLPQDVPGAIDVIVADHTQTIDVGQVNGRYFINNSSIGLYPRIVRQREKEQRLGKGKWWAAAWAALRAIRISPFLRVRLMTENRQFNRKTTFVFIGNNAYEMDLYNIGRRSRLDGGTLSVYLLRGGGRWGVVIMVIRTFLGLLRQTKDFEELETQELTIEMRRSKVLVATDGEVSMMDAPLKYKIEPGALKVVVPKPQ
jgi:YegS/Rv2252/BmrU family lipid kinase